jgi:hypothetical protein
MRLNKKNIYIYIYLFMINSNIPYCPNDSTLNQETKMCEEKTIIRVCPIGYNFNKISEKCIMAITPECPTGYRFNDINNNCIKLVPAVCPSGYIMSADNCVKIPMCPIGHKYDLSSKSCTIEKPMLVCPPNTTYNLTEKKCTNLTNMIGNCKPGFTISNDAFCLNNFDPICRTGGVLRRDANGNGKCIFGPNM